MITLLGNAGIITSTTPAVVTHTTTAGSLLVAMCSRTASSDFFTGVTDTAGNTWTLAAAAPSSGSVGRRVELWYCANARSITSLSVAFAGTSQAAVTLHEFAGVATTNALDTAFAKFQSSSLAPTAANVTPSTANSLVIGMLRANASGAQTYTLTSTGWTSNNVAMGENHAVAYILNPTVGVATGPTWTLALSAGSGSVTAAFKAAPTATVKTWDGTQWVNANASTPIGYWNGSQWTSPASGKIKEWDGTQWQVVL